MDSIKIASDDIHELKDSVAPVYVMQYEMHISELIRRIVTEGCKKYPEENNTTCSARVRIKGNLFNIQVDLTSSIQQLCCDEFLVRLIFAVNIMEQFIKTKPKLKLKPKYEHCLH